MMKMNKTQAILSLGSISLLTTIALTIGYAFIPKTTDSGDKNGWRTAVGVTAITLFFVSVGLITVGAYRTNKGFDKVMQIS